LFTVRPEQFAAAGGRVRVAFDWTPATGGMMVRQDTNVEGHMGRIAGIRIAGLRIALAAATAGAAALASVMLGGTPANALRLHDDIYYYSSVTPRYGYTPRHPFGAYWLYARPHCARYAQFYPIAGAVVYHGLPCR
jgi:hypothetical protein